jgi:hypothetical protein
MSGVSSSVDRNNMEFLVPKQIYNFLTGNADDITRQDGFFDSLCKLVENVNHYDPCSNGDYTLKTFIKSLVPGSGSGSVNFEEKVSSNTDVQKMLETACINLNGAPFMRTVLDSDEDIKLLTSQITQYFDSKFQNSYKYLNSKNGDFDKIKGIDINSANFLNTYTNFVNEEGVVVDLDKVVFENIPITTGGAYTGTSGSEQKVRLNLKRDGDKIKLFNVLSTNLNVKKINMCRDNGEKLYYTPGSDDDVYDNILMPLYNGKTDRYALKKKLEPRCKLQHQGNDISECGSVINAENLDKRHIKAWTPREHGSSASTVNAMSYLQKTRAQPALTPVDGTTLSQYLPRALGFMGGSMEGGEKLDLTFKSDDCASGLEDKNLRVRQSTQYLELFKSVVQRLDNHNPVHKDVIDRLKADLNGYKQAECKLFNDAFRLANALNSQNNGTLSGPINKDTFAAFTKSNDDVSKKQTNLLGCLTEILTETCKKP